MPNLEPDFVRFDVGPQPERDAILEELRRQHFGIKAIANKLRAEGLDTTALLIKGATVATILKAAAKLGVDIIIVGSHGRGAMHQLLVGNVSEGVLRHAECPVLVIPTRARA